MCNHDILIPILLQFLDNIIAFLLPQSKAVIMKMCKKPHLTGFTKNQLSLL
jgi:hypothetical protein